VRPLPSGLFDGVDREPELASRDHEVGGAVERVGREPAPFGQRRRVDLADRVTRDAREGDVQRVCRGVERHPGGAVLARDRPDNAAIEVDDRDARGVCAARDEDMLSNRIDRNPGSVTGDAGRKLSCRVGVGGGSRPDENGGETYEKSQALSHAATLRPMALCAKRRRGARWADLGQAATSYSDHHGNLEQARGGSGRRSAADVQPDPVVCAVVVVRGGVTVTVQLSRWRARRAAVFNGP
jgi:hypothetical protein